MTISQKNIFYTFIVGFLSFSLGFFLQSGINVYHNDVQTGSGPIYMSEKAKEVYTFIEKYYYSFGSKDRKKMEDAYLSSMATSLGDKYTNYFNEKDSEKFIESLAGDFQGIGAVIQDHKTGILITKVIPKSPAEKNELSAGDIIVRVNGESMAGVPVTDAVDKIRGPKGTVVKLTIQKKETKKEEDISITRDVVIVPSVDSKMLTGSVGYVEIAVFGETTSKDVEVALKTLIASGAESIILDGRNNGGGYLESAVDILSLFLDENVIGVVTKSNHESDNQTFYTHKKDFTIPRNIPVVMLMNSMSASATEITAGALQDYERALIVGDVSYGKGSVQIPFHLSDGSMIKITTAKWFTPKDRGIDEKGIIPDVAIHFLDEDYKANFDRQLEGALKILTIKKDENLTFPEWKEASTKLTF